MKILVVDESATMRWVIINILERCGYTQIREAKDGQEALYIQARDPVDVVITDWFMKGMDGQTFIEKLRAGYGETLAILMVATSLSRDDIKTAGKAGADNYIVRPFSPELLKAKLAGLTEQVLSL